MFVLPAVNDGLNGNGSAHELPLGPLLTSNVEDDGTAGLPDHGAIDALVVYAPHNAGVANGALSPPKKCNSRSSNGSCGVFLNVDTSCPVTGSGCTSPASLINKPALTSSATMYIATNEPKGFASCEAKYTAPTNSSGNTGVLMLTVPIREASGQDGPLSLSSAISLSAQEVNPSAAAGFKATPSGNATVVSFTLASDKPVATRLSSWGTCTFTVNPDGVLAASLSGATLMLGSNPNRLQPSKPSINAGLAVGKVKGVGSLLVGHESPSTDVSNGPVHDVGNVTRGGGCCSLAAGQTPPIS